MKRSHWLISACGLMLATVAAAPAGDIYVDGSNASGTELGTQQSPFRKVQSAIDAAAGGDRIRVAAGTYVENLRIDSKAIILEGGYSGAWVRDTAANPTTLSSAGGNAVINLIAADATIDGFRITGGTGSTEEVPYGYHGGGIYSRDGSPTISNNIIENNDVRKNDAASDYNYGGGAYVTNATTVTIMNNVVRGNSAGRGAGIAVFGQEAHILGNTIESNIAIGDHGGGMFIGVVNATVSQNIIRRNEVGRDLGYGWGGGLIVVNKGNSAELSFNTVYENFAAAFGSGEFVDEGAHADIHHELIYGNLSKAECESISAIYIDGGEGVGSTATISFCTIVGNICENSTRGNGLQVEGKSVVSVTNSIFWDNGGDDFAVFDTSSINATFVCSEEAIAGTGNISDDPRFVNASANDYHLGAGSPCIDAGDPASPFNFEPADNGGRADMGRYGNATDAPSAAELSDSGTGSGGGSGDNSQPATDETAPPSNDSVSSAGLCPTASAMLLSISLIGVGRSRRSRSDSAKRDAADAV